MIESSVSLRSVIKVNGECTHQVNDLLAAEEPLEIRLCFGAFPHRKQQSISVTMRTPGNDFELATGFLFTEGIIKDVEDIHSIKHCNGLKENVVKVELKEEVLVDIGKLERNFYTTSSCGVCGKSSIESVRTVCRLTDTTHDQLRFSTDIIYTLPAALRHRQAIFENTGGLHGCAIFDTAGNLILAREDVGRHNAVDKLIGAALTQYAFPLSNFLLLLSGRASFELIQKAWMAGIKIVAAVGAPSSLAVQMAEECDMTLIGFLREKVFNIYTGEHRIVITAYENSYKR